MSQYVIDLDNIVTLARVFLNSDLTEHQRHMVKVELRRAIAQYDKRSDISFDLNAASAEILNRFNIK